MAATPLKTPEQLAREAIDHKYGLGTRWEQPDEEGREGFARAQAEAFADTGEHIEADEIRRLIEFAIAADRRQIAQALEGHGPVPGIRAFARPSVSQLIDAYAAWDGEVDTFVAVWDACFAGTEFPCPAHPAGIHTTYLVDDGSCDGCGDKNRG